MQSSKESCLQYFFVFLAFNIFPILFFLCPLKSIMKIEKNIYKTKTTKAKPFYKTNRVRSFDLHSFILVSFSICSLKCAPVLKRLP